MILTRVSTFRAGTICVRDLFARELLSDRCDRCVGEGRFVFLISWSRRSRFAHAEHSAIEKASQENNFRSPKMYTGCFDETVDIYALGTLSCRGDVHVCVRVRALCVRCAVSFCAAMLCSRKGTSGSTHIEHVTSSIHNHNQGRRFWSSPKPAMVHNPLVHGRRWTGCRCWCRSCKATGAPPVTRRPRSVWTSWTAC